MKWDNIKYILIIVLLFVVVSYSLDKWVYFGIGKIDDKVFSGQTTGKLNQYMDVKDSLDFIVFGSSRANHNVNPEVFSENGFNMGMDGQKIAYSATLVKLLSDKKQTLLFHIEPKNALDLEYTGDDLKSLEIKFHQNKTINDEIKRFGQENPIGSFYWCTVYSGKILGIIKNYLRPNYDHKSYSGYDPIVVSDHQKSIFKKMVNNRRKDSCETSVNYRLNNIYDIYLNELKMFSEANNKRLVLFTSPILHDDCKEDNFYFEHVMKSKGLTYFDFTDLYKKDSTYTYWKDFTHLSSVGAEKFTRDIKKTIFNEK